MEILNILLIEDNPSDAELVRVHLEEVSFPFKMECVRSLAEAVAFLGRPDTDVILVDLGLPDSSGIETFRVLNSLATDIPIVVLSGLTDENTAVVAVSEGAQDHLPKEDVSGPLLSRSIRYAIERNRRQQGERELNAIRQVQRRLYPQTGPCINGLDIAGESYPAEFACGDYFDFIRMANGTIAVVVGDVSGHGVGPALMMVETRAYLRACIGDRPRIGNALTQINRLLVEDTVSDRFVSLFLAQIDPKTRMLEYAGAGHDAYILTQSGDFEHLDSTGPVAGILPGAEIAPFPPRQLKPDEILVIMTDGFPETTSPQREMIGTKRVLQALARHRDSAARQIVHDLWRETREFAQGSDQLDDMTVAVVKVL